MKVIDHLLAKINSEIVTNLGVYNKRYNNISFFLKEEIIYLYNLFILYLFY